MENIKRKKEKLLKITDDLDIKAKAESTTLSVGERAASKEANKKIRCLRRDEETNGHKGQKSNTFRRVEIT